MMIEVESLVKTFGVALQETGIDKVLTGRELLVQTLLIFLSTTFVPKELIEAEWLKVAATFNPTTYIFEGMRAVLTQPTIDWSALSAGLAVAGR